MFAVFSKIFSTISHRAARGQAIVEYAIIAALVAGMAVFAVMYVGQETDKNLCKGSNALGEVTGYHDERCPVELADDGTTSGIGPDGFEDLYLALEEVAIRRVLLPVSVFDMSGMNEVIVETDRPDSIAACYALKGGQVTCAAMMGTSSAFDFPANVVAVGYAILPVADVRIEMAQPISITLGARDDAALRKTWNIHAYRPALPNLFEPEVAFEDHEFMAGMVGEQSVLQPLLGKFSADDLILEVIPGSGAGAFSGCGQSANAENARCELPQTDPSVAMVPSNGKALGYQLYLPRDVRIPVSWPLSLSLASSFEPDVKVEWDITISRPAGEAPAFPDLVFEDTEFPADTTERSFVMSAVDQSYPSDFRIWMPQSDAGLRACYRETAEANPVCSPDASGGEVKFIVPAGVYSLGVGVDLPENVLIDFARQVTFSVNAVDYPDFNDDFEIAVSRPAFVPEFDPSFAFGDVTFPEGSVSWQTHLVEMTGTFNGQLTMSMPADQDSLRLCYQAVEGGSVSCSQTGKASTSASGVSPASVGKTIDYTVPSEAYALGFSVNLGDSAFRAIEQEVSFSLTHSRDASLTRSYGLSATRAATSVVFEPDTSAMIFSDETWPEATDGWQDPQMVAKAGTFNTDLKLSIPAGVGAGACYSIAGADPVCSESALNQAVNFVIPMEATRFGVRTSLEDSLYVDLQRLVSFVLGSTESPDYAVPFSYNVSRPAVPVRFDPNLGFRNKTFSVGTTGAQQVMVPIEGEITTGLDITVPQVDFSLRACYVDVAGANPVCSTNAKDGEVLLSVPRNSVSIGYEVVLPSDKYLEWSENVAFRVASDADETLEYDVAVTVDRTVVPVRVNPSFTFDDISFAAGTTGPQTLIQDLVGEFTTDVRVRMSLTGHEIAPCFEKVAGAGPSCGANTVEQAQSVTATWSSEQKEEGLTIHGAGYRVDLPADVHEPVSWNVELRLESVYDANVGRTFSFRIERDAVPVVWAPDASMKLPDMEFPVRSTGTRGAMIEFAGEFTTGTDYTIGATGYAISPCYRKVASGEISCGGSSETGNAMVEIDPDWEAIGYRIELPTDLAQEVDREVQVDLRSSYDPSLFRTDSFRIYREPAPVVFSPTVSFSNQTFSNGQIGWQSNMEPLTGELTTNLELVSDGARPIKLCVRDSASDDLRCTSGKTGAQQVLSVAPTAYAIGAAVELPQDPWIEDRQSVTFDLRMADFPSQKRSYAYEVHRPLLDMEFAATTTFSDVALPVGDSGWKTYMEPLSGTFSTALEWVAVAPGDDFRLCVQETSSSAVACEPVGVNTHQLTADTFAIGYSVEVSDEEFVDYARVANMRLQSAQAPTVGRDFAPTVSRPGRAVDFPAADLFTAMTFDVGARGAKTIMGQVGGVGNTPMRITLGKEQFDVRLCIQLTAGSPVTCQATTPSEGPQSYDFDATTYAVGYRVVLPDDAFEVFSKTIGLTISSRTVAEVEQAYQVSLNREVQMPVMPAADLFTNQSYAPGTIGAQTVMRALDPKIDTNLTLRKEADQAGVGICFQKSRSGEITCTGEAASTVVEVSDTDRSWYAVGYRFPLGEDPNEEIFETVRLKLVSQAVPAAETAYNVGVSRLSMNAVMPDRTFFTDMHYPEGETGPRTVLVPLGQTDIDLVLHKAEGQAGLELCYQAVDGGPETCSGSGTAAHSLAVSSGWHAIGYKFSLGASKFYPVDETFLMSITARDGWSNRVEYAVDVTRPHVEMVMPSAAMFEDLALPEGTVYTQTVMKPIDPTVNTSLAMTKGAGQVGLQVCRQVSVGGAIDCTGENVSGEHTVDFALGDYAAGYRFNLGESEYMGFDETFALTLSSRDETDVKVDYAVHVTRPAKNVVMPAGDFFTNIEIPMSQGDTYYEMKATQGIVDSPMKLTIAKNEASWPFRACVTKERDTSPTCAILPESSQYMDSVAAIDATSKAVGFRFDLPASEYAPFDYPLQLTLESTLDPSKKVVYNITAHREAKEVVLPPADLFAAEVHFEPAATDWQTVLVPIRDVISSEYQLNLSAQDFQISLCHRSTAAGSPQCNQSAHGVDAELGVSPNHYEVGFTVHTGSDQYQAFDKTFVLRMRSSHDVTKFVDYEVHVSRPGAEVALPPDDFFPDIILEAGTTGSQKFMYPLSGVLNSSVLMTMEAQDFPLNLCYVNEWSTSKCIASADGQEAMQNYGQNWKFIGYTFDVGTSKYEDFAKTLRFRISAQANPDRYQDYEVNIRRQAPDIVLPSADLFEDVELASTDIQWQTVTQSIAGVLKSPVRIEMPSHDFQVAICKDTTCSWGAPGSVEVSESTKSIGFRVYTAGSQYAEFDGIVRFRVVSMIDESKYVDYAVRVTKPATPPAFSVSGADFSHAFPASAGGIERFMVYNDGSKWTVPVRFYTAGQNTLRMRPCYQDTPSSEVVCKAVFSTGVDWIQNSSGVVPYAIGYEVDFSNKAAPGTALNLAVRVAVHKHGSSSGTAYDITVSRPSQ